MTQSSQPPAQPDREPTGTPEASNTPTAKSENAAPEGKKRPTTSDLMSLPSRAIRPLGLEASRKLAAAAARVALENNGEDVIVLDVSEQSAEFDFFVLANGASRRQLHAISEQIDDALEKGLGDRRMGIEGYQDSSWIVLDYGSIVIHLFDEETREFYDLESLWADGKRVPLDSLGLNPDGSIIQ